MANRTPPEDDPRFTAGLVIDVRRVLIEHGYSVPTGDVGLAAAELVELQQALFRFLYQDSDVGNRQALDDTSVIT